jgi:hypothetical protein
MWHRLRSPTAVVVLCAMAFTQGCHGPSWVRAKSGVEQQRVYLSRASLFTLHHRGEGGVPLQCTVRQAEGTVLRMTADSIVLRAVTVIRGPTVGTCTIVGDASVVMADVPGLTVRRRVLSPLRSAALIVSAGVALLFIAFVLDPPLD